MIGWVPDSVANFVDKARHDASRWTFRDAVSQKRKIKASESLHDDERTVAMVLETASERSMGFFLEPYQIHRCARRAMACVRRV